MKNSLSNQKSTELIYASKDAFLHILKGHLTFAIVKREMPVERGDIVIIVEFINGLETSARTPKKVREVYDTSLFNQKIKGHKFITF